MKSRLLMVGIALLLALMSAYGISLYVRSLKAKVEQEEKQLKVLTASENLSIGTSYKEMTSRRMVSFKEVPQKYIVSGAITSPDRIDGQVLATRVNKGEQLTADKFKYSTQAGLSFAIPKDNVAVSIPLDEVRGVAGMIKAGDYVSILATFEDVGDAKKTTLTRLLLQKVRVLAVGSIIAPPEGRAEEKKTLVSAGGSRPTSERQTLTLSLSAVDAEKLVFAEENGKVWLTLLPTKEAAPVPTSGRSIDTVFNP